jgi:putative transposase
MSQHRTYYRRFLPHYQPPGATLFVTFRLAGSLPQAVLEELQAQRDRRAHKLSHIEDPAERKTKAYLEERRAFRRWDTALDRAKTGPRWLSEPEIATLTAEALHFRDNRAYDLLAFCVMPNHVHLVCTPLQREDGTYDALHAILQSLKTYAARRANGILARRGAFWQPENYDHVVRDNAELTRILAYVIQNPVKAGLVPAWDSWPWTYVSSQYR